MVRESRSQSRKLAAIDTSQHPAELTEVLPALIESRTLIDRYLAGFPQHDRDAVFDDVRRDCVAQFHHVKSLESALDPASLTVDHVAAFLWDNLAPAVFRQLAWTPGWLQEEAYDATNESILEYLRIASGTKVTNPTGLLLVIARRRLLDQHRKSRPHWMTMLSWEENPAQVHVVPSADDETTTIELFVSVNEVISELVLKEPRSARVFMLWWTEDLSSQEIARRLGVSKRTVTRDLAKVMHHLRSRLFPSADLAEGSGDQGDGS